MGDTDDSTRPAGVAAPAPALLPPPPPPVTRLVPPCDRAAGRRAAGRVGAAHVVLVVVAMAGPVAVLVWFAVTAADGAAATAVFCGQFWGVYLATAHSTARWGRCPFSVVSDYLAGGLGAGESPRFARRVAACGGRAAVRGVVVECLGVALGYTAALTVVMAAIPGVGGSGRPDPGAVAAGWAGGAAVLAGLAAWVWAAAAATLVGGKACRA